VLIILIALSNLSSGKWPIEPYSGRWWEDGSACFLASSLPAHIAAETRTTLSKRFSELPS
jgi:hypothetical protein